MSRALIVYCTLPEGPESVTLCQTLVHERLVACVNLLPQIRSLYRWQGKICDDAEQLAIMKTTSERFEALRARIVELHPYDCPEVLACDIAEGHAPYLDWVREMTSVSAES